MESSVLSGPFLAAVSCEDAAFTGLWLGSLSVLLLQRQRTGSLYCEITIWDVLDMVSVRLGTNGITTGNL